MKVLWFTNTPCGATEQLTGCKVSGGGWLYALSQALINNSEVDLHIAFYWKERMESFSIDGITYHPIENKQYSSRWGRIISSLFTVIRKDRISPKLLSKLDRIVSEVRPDIIHVHGSEMNYGLISEFRNEKVVLSIQGLVSPILLKLFSGYSKHDVTAHDSIKHLLTLSGVNAQERRMKVQAMTEQRMFKSIKYIIGRTDWDKSCSLALNPTRKYYVVNEILRPEFLEKSWTPSMENARFRIVTTVSGGLYKGVETIYRTAAILKEVGFPFSWTVIGVSSSDYIIELTERLERKKCKDLCINLLGRKDANGMLTALLDSDLFVQVSHIENSPNSLCEAMLLGMPIIATYAGGTSSILTNGKEGVLVPDGDPYVLAGLIMRINHDYPNFISMGNNARERALFRHNPENVVNELLNVYYQIQNDK